MIFRASFVPLVLDISAKPKTIPKQMQKGMVIFMDETDHAAAWRCYLELLRQSGRFGFHDTLWQAGLQSPFEPASIRDIGLRAQALLNQMNEVIG